jgi:hypothetical protein
VVGAAVICRTGGSALFSAAARISLISAITGITGMTGSEPSIDAISPPDELKSTEFVDQSAASAGENTGQSRRPGALLES